MKKPTRAEQAEMRKMWEDVVIRPLMKKVINKEPTKSGKVHSLEVFDKIDNIIEKNYKKQLGLTSKDILGMKFEYIVDAIYDEIVPVKPKPKIAPQRAKYPPKKGENGTKLNNKSVYYKAYKDLKSGATKAPNLYDCRLFNKLSIPTNTGITLDPTNKLAINFYKNFISKDKNDIRNGVYFGKDVVVASNDNVAVIVKGRKEWFDKDYKKGIYTVKSPVYTTKLEGSYPTPQIDFNQNNYYFMDINNIGNDNFWEYITLIKNSDLSEENNCFISWKIEDSYIHYCVDINDLYNCYKAIAGALEFKSFRLSLPKENGKPIIISLANKDIGDNEDGNVYVAINTKPHNIPENEIPIYINFTRHQTPIITTQGTFELNNNTAITIDWEDGGVTTFANSGSDWDFSIQPQKLKKMGKFLEDAGVSPYWIIDRKTNSFLKKKNVYGKIWIKFDLTSRWKPTLHNVLEGEEDILYELRNGMFYPIYAEWAEEKIYELQNWEKLHEHEFKKTLKGLAGRFNELFISGDDEYNYWISENVKFDNSQPTIFDDTLGGTMEFTDEETFTIYD